MTYTGHVKNGVVVLDDKVKLPEGAEVTVNLRDSGDDGAAQDVTPTLYERLKPVIGAAKGLPPDLAENHDHYLHGRPRK